MLENWRKGGKEENWVNFVLFVEKMECSGEINWFRSMLWRIWKLVKLIGIHESSYLVIFVQFDSVGIIEFTRAQYECRNHN